MEKKRILLTGGTGCIGSHLAAELLSMGNAVYFLTRSSNQLSAHERVSRALSPLVSLGDREFHVIDRDVTAPLEDLALPDIDEVWHAAAVLSFKEEHRERTLRTNLGGTQNLLDWMTRRRVSRLHYVGTAYAAGARQGIIKEDDALLSAGFHNSYEESKAKAEKAVHEWGKETGGIATVYRPSIIVGATATGAISGFSGYYVLARNMVMLRLYLEQLLQDDPASCGAEGVRKKENGDLQVPLHFPGDPQATVNLLPIDVFVSAMMALRERDASGVFHLVNETPPTCQELLEVTMPPLQLSGITMGGSSPAGTMLAKLEADIASGWQYYLPYLGSFQQFDMSYTRAALGYAPQFRVTPEYARRILDYAKLRHFKRR